MNSFSGQVIHHKHSHFHIYATSISFQDSLCDRMERQEQMTLMTNVNPLQKMVSYCIQNMSI